jgi:GNAT superfamily N-acetyltransferase
MGFTRFEELLPPLPSPGCELRTYRPGDEDPWVELLSSGYFGPWDRARLDRMLAGGRAPMPLEGVFFVTAGDLPVGTACTFLRPGQSGDLPELGWVAEHPDYRGQGLGKLACLAVSLRQRWASTIFSC